MKKGKKMLNAKLEHRMVGPHALSYEVSTFIDIYIYIYIDVIFVNNDVCVDVCVYSINII